jgi:hypothetical protein
MKTILFLVLAAGFMNTAYAKDSDWKICIGNTTLFGDKTQVVVNLFEHRNGDGRATDLTLIYGANILRGEFDSTESDSSMVILKNENSNFGGKATMDYTKNILTLQGRINLYGSVSVLSSKLSCKTLLN